MSQAADPFRIGLLGRGTVGSAFATLLAERADHVANVTASNSVSNSVSATPGGVGVTQAMNTAALADATDPSTAAAYSIGQQLITSAWNVLFAVVLVSWVFGWSGGKALVESSYEGAREKSRELKEKRRAARAGQPASNMRRPHEEES